MSTPTVESYFVLEKSDWLTLNPNPSRMAVSTPPSKDRVQRRRLTMYGRDIVAGVWRRHDIVPWCFTCESFHVLCLFFFGAHCRFFPPCQWKTRLIVVSKSSNEYIVSYAYADPSSTIKLSTFPPFTSLHPPNPPPPTPQQQHPSPHSHSVDTAHHQHQPYHKPLLPQHHLHHSQPHQKTPPASFLLHPRPSSTTSQAPPHQPHPLPP
jgi:hypothetical protein